MASKRINCLRRLKEVCVVPRSEMPHLRLMRKTRINGTRESMAMMADTMPTKTRRFTFRNHHCEVFNAKGKQDEHGEPMSSRMNHNKKQHKLICIYVVVCVFQKNKLHHCDMRTVSLK